MTSLGQSEGKTNPPHAQDKHQADPLLVTSRLEIGELLALVKVDDKREDFWWKTVNGSPVVTGGVDA